MLAIESEPGGRPLALAGILSLLYVILCGGYIMVSRKIAANVSTSVAELQSIKMAKGMLFVVATGLSYFVASFLLLKRISGQEARTLPTESHPGGAGGEEVSSLTLKLQFTIFV